MDVSSLALTATMMWLILSSGVGFGWVGSVCCPGIRSVSVQRSVVVV